MNKITIKRTDGGSITEKKLSGYFVDVYVGNECIGTCITDGSLSAYECYKSMKHNQVINEREKNHYNNIH
jgi:hypothetical protein